MKSFNNHADKKRNTAIVKLSLIALLIFFCYNLATNVNNFQSLVLSPAADYDNNISTAAATSTNFATHPPLKLEIEDDGGNLTINDAKSEQEVDDVDQQQCCYTSWLTMTDYIKQCMLLALRAPLWNNAHRVVNVCAQPLARQLKMELLYNADDVKGFVPFAANATNRSCTAVTFGIGGDINAELQLLNRVKKCNFYGADPVQKSGHVFKQIGKYYQVAVGAKNGFIRANVLEDPADVYNYTAKTVPTLTLPAFLHTAQLFDNHIDFLLMDNEHAEYDLLPQFQRNQLIDQHNITVCQLSVEIHGPVDTKNKQSSSKWDLFFTDFLKHSHFLPLWASAPSNHQRLFLIDVQHRVCYTKFYGQVCTDLNTSTEVIN